MGGRQQFHHHPRTTAARSLPLVVAFFSLLLLALSILYFLSSSSSSSYDASSFPLRSSQPPDYSFLASLHKFLKSTSHSHPHPHPHDHRVVESSDKLDDGIWKVETQRLYHGFNSPPPPLRVYVYEMPSKFTYDLLTLFLNSYRDTSNLTSNGSPVHRLIEQHSVDYWLWADLIAPESQRLLNNVVVRVTKQEEADLFYIPFFTTISFFLLEKQQCKALYRVKLWSG